MALTGWLRGLPALLPGLQEVTVVMGNEACDLDSGVCAIVLAFHLSSVTQRPVLPLLNIHRTDFVLKTELVAALAAEGVAEELLWFRDSRPAPLSLPGLRLVLVDHNLLPVRDRALGDRVVEVLDHHVRETDLQEELVTIEPVGSCSSLVLRRLITDTPEFSDPSCLRLVRAAILLDTVCLRPEAQRVTPTDLAMVQEAEERLLATAAAGQDRHQVFDWLLAEKGRVGHLDTHQLLRRDLKVVGEGPGQVAVSSLPLLCTQFIRLPGWPDHVQAFLESGPYAALVVLGINIVESAVTRDLLLGGRDTGVVEAVRRGLEGCTEPDLGLFHSTGCPAGILGFRHYTQANSAASRKQILPAVRRALV